MDDTAVCARCAQSKRLEDTSIVEVLLTPCTCARWCSAYGCNPGEPHE